MFLFSRAFRFHDVRQKYPPLKIMREIKAIYSNYIAISVNLTSEKSYSNTTFHFLKSPTV